MTQNQITISTLSQVKENKEGLLLIDKPTGWTSFDVVAKIRNLTRVKKVGHAGTLDPLATGLLIILVGKKFTRLQDNFLKQDKEYLATGRLGIITDTYDIDGKVTSQAVWDKVAQINLAQLQSVVDKFQGEIDQTVPAFSAIKRQGKKLYELARKGEKIDLPTRKVSIHSLEVLDLAVDDIVCQSEFKIQTKVSSGTYIRSLIFDIGQELGVGATVTELRRTKIGDFSVSQAEEIV